MPDGMQPALKQGPTYSTYLSELRRELTRKGWYAADNGKTYCPFHAENARRIDEAARSKARSI